MEFDVPQWINELWVNGKILQSAWFAGVVGNLLASGMYDAFKSGAKQRVANRREIWRDAADLKNPELLRVLRLAECDAIIAVCETCLLEDYHVDPSTLRMLISPSKWRGLSAKYTNPEVDAVLLLRSLLLAAYHETLKGNPKDFEKELSVAIENVAELAQRDSADINISSLEELKENATAEFEEGFRQLLEREFHVGLPNQFFKRLRLHWFDYLRISLRRNLLRNEAARKAFEIDVLSGVPSLVKGVQVAFGDMQEQLTEQDKKLNDIFDFIRLALGKRDEQTPDIREVDADTAKLIELATKQFRELVAAEAIANERHADQIRELVRIRTAAEDTTAITARQLDLLTGNRPQEIDISAYKRAICARYRHLRLETLSADQLYYQDIELQAVFIPQHVRNCQQWLPQALEAPKELGAKRELKGGMAIVEVRDLADFQKQKPREVLDTVLAPDHRLTTLLGDPGAGKSSLAIILLLKWATASNEGAPELPVLIELRHYHRTADGKDFIEYLQDAPDLFYRFSAASLKSRLNEPGVTLIFDGLDEVFEPDARARVLDQIARYASDFPAARILVTSRLVGYPPRVLRDARFGHWLLQDFTLPKIHEFLNRWCSVAVRVENDRERVKQRVTGAIQVAAIREMAGNPLLLTMMAMLARQRDLPRDQAGLYSKCAELLLELWDTQKALAEHPDLRDAYLDIQDKQIVLRRLAWRMQTGQFGLRGNLVARAILEEVMDAALARIDDSGRRRRVVRVLIDQLRERNFVLCHLGGEQYAFVHRGFLEYFCAEDIRYRFESERSLSEEQLAEIFREHCYDDAWKEVLVLAANSLDPKVADKVLAPLVALADESKQGPIDIVYSVLTRARDPSALTTSRDAAWKFFAKGTTATKGKFRNRCLRAVIEHWADAKTRDLLEGLARNAPTSTRRRAIETLARKWPDEHTRKLIEDAFLLSSDSKVALAALRGFTRTWGDDRSELDRILINIVKSGKDPRTQAFALEKLGQQRHSEIRRLLEDIAFSDLDGTLRAATTLATFWPDEHTRSLLSELARNRRERKVSRQSLVALVQHWPDDATRDLLLEIALRDEESIAATEAIALLPTRWRVDQVRDSLALIVISFSSRQSRVQALASLATQWQSFLQESPQLPAFLRTEEGRALAAEAAVARYTSAPARIYLREIGMQAQGPYLNI